MKSFSAASLLILIANCQFLLGQTGTNLGSVNIGSSATVTVTAVFQQAGTLGTIAVLTKGATGLDFTNAGTGTCAVSTPYAAGASCTVNVTFTPKASGTRYGAVTLTDGSSTVLATSYVYGTGNGPQIVFTSGPLSTISTILSSPDGVAVDGNGNVYVAYQDRTIVYEILAAGGYSTTVEVASGFTWLSSIAVDGSGNVFVSDYQLNAVYEIVAVGGSIPATPVIKTLGSGFLQPSGVAVDKGGNVYVADTGNNAVKEILAVNGIIPPLPVINTLGSGFNLPGDVAVDASGDVFVADENNNAVKEIVAVGGVIPATPVINTLGSGFSYLWCRVGREWERLRRRYF